MTPPSRMSFLTAHHPKDIGVWTNQCILSSDVPTFAHALGAIGYETVLCGRMHFVSIDQRHGFEKRLVGDVTAMYHGGRGPRFDHIPVATTGQTRIAVEIAGAGRTVYQAFDDAVTDACIKFLRERDSGRPLCMVVGFVLPHCPYIAPKTLFEHYYDRVKIPSVPDGYWEAMHPAMINWRRRRRIEDLTEEQIRTARAGYYGLVEYLDTLIGKIIETLHELRMVERTIVIYTSDHGDMVGEHGLWWKSNFYEGSVGVPLIFAGAHLPKGIVCERVVSLLDVTATVIDIADAPPLPHSLGRSLVPLLCESPNGVDWEDVAFAELCTFTDPFMRMVRRGDWKLVYFDGYERPQLFNLRDDPNEFNDLATDESYSDVVCELLGEVLHDWHPQCIRKTIEQRRERIALLREWCKRVQPPDPDHWREPEGCNVFPER
ncbi:MAG TPA: hypothetical protein EYP10_06135 [Armatimonadetes bacterium]|nr:hypothetical protein [Armatimonadota bacterium]